MRVALAIVWMFAVAFAAGDAQVAGSRSGASESERSPADAAAFLSQYCITCHNQRAKTGGLALDAIDVAHVALDAATWEKVVRKIRTGMMPPAGAPRPDRRALDAFASDLETRLDRAAIAGANLATPALHRLNRNEYANAIRDLPGSRDRRRAATAGRWRQ